MAADPDDRLLRALGLPALVGLGMGAIVGAGIYVLVGEVAGHAGAGTPLAFLLAGLLALPTAFSYAELAARMPEAAGAAAYVRAGLASPLAGRIAGLAVALTALLAIAAIARGAESYLARFVPLPPGVGAGGLIVLATAIALYGVRETALVAGLSTAVEIGGLLYVCLAGVMAVADGTAAAPAPAAWFAGIEAGAVFGGAFVAFFAFLGFEVLANMGEEARDTRRALPLAILLSIVLSSLLYVAVAAAAVLAIGADRLAASEAPLAEVVAAWTAGHPEVLAAIALAAIANGVLIEIALLSRVLYGMARRGWLPGPLARVHDRRRTPTVATLSAGAVALVLAVSFPVGTLAGWTSTATLLLFVAVNLALWRLHRTDPRPDLAFRPPRWLPPFAALCSAALLGGQFLG